MARRKREASSDGSAPAGSGWAHKSWDDGSFVAWCPNQGAVFEDCGAVDVRHGWHDPERWADIRRRIKAV